MKQAWLSAAEVVDAWRVWPRLLLIGYCYFVFTLTEKLVTWYMGLPAAERSLEASGMAVAIFTAVTAFGTQFLNAYLKSGRKWDGKQDDSAG